MMQCVIVALSYALLAEEACRGSQVGLPRTALLRHYPCGATAWQRMSYIALLQLPVALLLPAKWFHRIAFLLSYSIRTSPLIAHFVMHATKGPTGVPGPTGRWYIMSAMWSCDLFNFLAIPVGAGAARQQGTYGGPMTNAPIVRVAGPLTSFAQGALPCHSWHTRRQHLLCIIHFDSCVSVPPQLQRAPPL